MRTTASPKEILARIRARSNGGEPTPSEIFYLRFTEDESRIASEKMNNLVLHPGSIWPPNLREIATLIHHGFLMEPIIEWAREHAAQTEMEVVDYLTLDDAISILRVDVWTDKAIILFKLYFADRIFTPDPSRLPQ